MKGCNPNKESQVNASSAPLGLLAFSSLDPRVQQVARYIENADMKVAIDRCRRKRDVSEGKIPTACRFLRQYLFLKAITGDGMEMIDQAADNLWHHWMLHTRDYREFQQEVSRIMGETIWIDHGPYKDGAMTRQPGREVFFERYAGFFGAHPRQGGRNERLARA